MTDLSLLEQRKIEAGVLVPFIRAFEERFGTEEVLELVQGVIEEMAFRRGQEMAKAGPGSPMEKVKSLIPVFRRGGAIELEVIEDSGDAFSFNVTRCRYAEFYREMGVPELGVLLSCARDFALTRGISDRVDLTRKRTIMEGHSHCDFRFRLTK